MKISKSTPQEKKLVSSQFLNNHKINQSTFMGIGFDSLLRLILVWLVLIAGASGLGWRLYKLQIQQEVRNGDGDIIYLPKRAEQQQTSSFRPYIPRRSIVDASGNVVSLDRVVYNIYIHPIIVKNDEDLQKEVSETQQNWNSLLAEKLAQILTDKDKNQILKLLNSKDTGVILAKNLNEEQTNRIKRLKLDGVDFERRYTRFYPQGELFADVIGYVNTDHIGQAGIEYSQENLLEREISDLELKAMKTVRRDGQGAFIPHSLPEGIIKLDDLQLQLTLDLRLQRAVRDSLKAQLQKFKAKRGLTIVMDAHNGEIVALACEPTFDPNEYFNYDFALFKNWAVTDSYEPGSTFKPINVAIALDEGVIQPDSIVLDAPAVQIDGWPISNASKQGLGWISITKALEVSSNTAMIHTMQKIDKNKYYQRLQELGLNKLMGVDMPFEANGYLKSKDVFTARQIEAAVSAFGQGISLTPLKLVQLHAALANGGKLVTPHVIRGLVNTQGDLASKPELKTKKIFSENSAYSVVKMMQSVVANGSGKAAITDGYYIGGKTGTAQKASDTGSYLPNAKITSFVSIFPTDKPRYVILTVVDEPQGHNTYGSTVAAPVVKEVIDALIRIKGIPPSYPISQDKKTNNNQVTD
jgi:cell division protein FtsI (penicillin-binding protein 3)